MTVEDTGDLHTSGERLPWTEPWYDQGLAIPAGLTIELLTANELVRLTQAISIVLVAHSIPRRLGGGATSEELALDKRRCRRVAHALTQSYRGWDKDTEIKPYKDEIVSQRGAQLDWATFSAEHLVEMQTRARLIVTWAVNTGEHRWGRKSANHFVNEQRWFVNAMR
jgi:hypothetical protein